MRRLFLSQSFFWLASNSGRMDLVHSLMGRICIAFCIAAVGVSCLSTLPEEAPHQGEKCMEAYYEARRNQQSITESYHVSNTLISYAGAVVWFGFIQGLAIPAIGIPMSYDHHETLVEKNRTLLQEGCSKGTI